jgi:hypothetical protein
MTRHNCRQSCKLRSKGVNSKFEDSANLNVSLVSLGLLCKGQLTERYVFSNLGKNLSPAFPIPILSFL